MAACFFHPWRALAFIASALIASSCGCVHGDAAPSEHSPPSPTGASANLTKTKLAGARVAADWQLKMLDKLAADAAYQDAWGLFSEGGWANAGQVMVYGSTDRSKLYAVVVEPERAQISLDAPLTAAAFTEVAKAVKDAEQLKDLDMVAFDALTFEYVHATKDAAGHITVAKRVFIRNGGKKDVHDYDALIAAFQHLRKKS